MLRSQIVKELRKQSGDSVGVITRKQLTDYLGYKDRHSVSPYLHGVARIGNGYAIEDVADRILEVENEKVIARGC